MRLFFTVTDPLPLANRPRKLPACTIVIVDGEKKISDPSELDRNGNGNGSGKSKTVDDVFKLPLPPKQKRSRRSNETEKKSNFLIDEERKRNQDQDVGESGQPPVLTKETSKK